MYNVYGDNFNRLKSKSTRVLARPGAMNHSGQTSIPKSGGNRSFSSLGEQCMHSCSPQYSWICGHSIANKGFHATAYLNRARNVIILFSSININILLAFFGHPTAN